MTALSSEAIDTVTREALEALEKSDTPAALESWRVAYIGRKGKLSLLLRRVKDVPAAERKAVGATGNAARQELQAAFKAKQATMARTSAVGGKQKASKGVTYLSGLPEPGHLHPLTITIRRIQDIFAKLGFTVVEGPLVEDPRYNFDLLNIPPDHPARAETDTFYLTDGHILRTHTSPVQIRAVLEYNLKPPFGIISPGAAFRAEKVDATHEASFLQIEALLIGQDVSIANFRAVVEYFYSQFFGTTTHIRLRPSFFPFVEPAFEVDMSCVFCKGEGCRICKQSGWIEMMGAGMVHPQVVRNMNLDPEVWQGFAFGGGIERLAMLLYNIPEMRLFRAGDLRFIKQFS